LNSTANPVVVVIGGPTASGKSGLAVDLARKHQGVVINADSMQQYAELSIITARPTAADQALAPHRLYGALSARERGTAARWRAMALDEVAAAHAAGKLPILVGGTGLYIRALMQGLADIPPIPEAVRYAARADYTALGGEAFRARLIAADPESAKLHAGDVTRLTRAWEVLAATGKSLNHWQKEAADGAPAGLDFRVVVLDPPRPQLYKSCDRRFEMMMQAGALAEAAALAALHLDPDLPAMKALGAPELIELSAGRLSREQAVIKAQQATRNYAKRQTTWFRHQLSASKLATAAHACHTISTLYVAEYRDAIIRRLDELLRV
jgi:tRNA dimethylallyltransferase